MDIKTLAYGMADATEPACWGRFGQDVLGMMAAPDGAGVTLRMDARAGRILVRPAATGRYAASGWELADQTAYAAALTDLRATDVPVRQGTAEETRLRHVQDMAWFLDPSGNRHELVWGFVTAPDRFVLPDGHGAAMGAARDDPQHWQAHHPPFQEPRLKLATVAES